MQGNSRKKRYWSSRNLDKPIVAELLLDGINKDALLKEIEKHTVYASSASTPIMECNYYELKCKDISITPCEVVNDMSLPGNYHELLMFQCLESEV